MIPPLFYITEASEKTKHPVRAGDILRVKSMGRGLGHEGKVAVIVDVVRRKFVMNCSGEYDERVFSQPEEAIAIVDGKRIEVRLEHLENLRKR